MGCFGCDCCVVVGTSLAFAPPPPPTFTPCNNQITATTAVQKITLTRTAPNNNGHPINDYDIRYRPANPGGPGAPGPNTPTTTNTSQASPTGTTYELQIRAKQHRRPKPLVTHHCRHPRPMRLHPTPPPDSAKSNASPTPAPHKPQPRRTPQTHTPPQTPHKPTLQIARRLALYTTIALTQPGRFLEHPLRRCRRK